MQYNALILNKQRNGIKIMVMLKIEKMSETQLQSANRFCQVHCDDYVDMITALKLKINDHTKVFFAECFIGKDLEKAKDACYDVANLIHIPSENGTLYFDISILKSMDLFAY